MASRTYGIRNEPLSTERDRARAIAYYHAHKKRCRKNALAYFRKHKTERNAYSREYMRRNRERLRNYKNQNEAKSRKANPDRHWARRLKYKYGISLADYNRLLQMQKEACAICGRSSNYDSRWGTRMRKLRVDHCHETGLVRGLLCQKCNMGISYFERNSDWLKAATEYLSQS